MERTWFDLQRFADSDDGQGQADASDLQPEEGTPPEQDAGAQQDTGADATADGGQQTSQTQATFSQEQVNRIIGERLAEERRRWERRLQEVQSRIPQPQPQQPQANVNPQERARKFLVDFSRDPEGVLRRFADTYLQAQQRSQMEQLQKAQAVVQEAISDLQLKYPDFHQHSPAVMQHIQTDPFLSSVVRSIGANASPELWSGVLERAYEAVKAKETQAASTAAGVQVAREQQALATAKQGAAVPRQSAVRQPQTKSPEDLLWEMMQASG